MVRGTRVRRRQRRAAAVQLTKQIADMEDVKSAIQREGEASPSRRRPEDGDGLLQNVNAQLATARPEQTPRPALCGAYS